MNRLYINYAYKFLNELSYLLVLQTPFSRLLSKYVDMPLLHQTYQLIVREVNLLY